MNIRFVNTKNNDYFYKIFLKVYDLDYSIREITDVDRMIIKDVIKLIDRLDIITCRKIASKLDVKGHYKLTKANIVKLLRNELHNLNERALLEIYEENKVLLDMYAHEVINALEISNYRFNKIKNTLKVSGTRKIFINNHTKTIKMYDRRFIYEIYNKNNENKEKG